MAKQWTREQRVAASIRIYRRRTGSSAEGPEHVHWAREIGTDTAFMIDLQCELTEAAEIIGELSRKAESDIWPSEADAWLARNRKEDA